MIHQPDSATTRLQSRGRWWLLSLAFVWSAVTVVVMLRYHVAQPLGEKSVTTNGHTYFGNPPALTIFQDDPVSFAFIVVLLSSGLHASSLDLAIRTIQRTTRIGGIAIAAGALLCCASLLGLLLGVASVGLVGALLILTGRPMKRSSTS